MELLRGEAASVYMLMSENPHPILMKNYSLRHVQNLFISIYGNRSPGMQEGKLTGVGHRENSVPAQIRRGGYFWRRAGREGVAG